MVMMVYCCSISVCGINEHIWLPCFALLCFVMRKDLGRPSHLAIAVETLES